MVSRQDSYVEEYIHNTPYGFHILFLGKDILLFFHKTFPLLHEFSASNYSSLVSVFWIWDFLNIRNRILSTMLSLAHSQKKENKNSLEILIHS